MRQMTDGQRTNLKNPRCGFFEVFKLLKEVFKRRRLALNEFSSPVTFPPSKSFIPLGRVRKKASAGLCWRSRVAEKLAA